jgi:hypothetical protein
MHMSVSHLFGLRNCQSLPMKFLNLVGPSNKVQKFLKNLLPPFYVI